MFDITEYVATITYYYNQPQYYKGQTTKIDVFWDFIDIWSQIFYQ